MSLPSRRRVGAPNVLLGIIRVARGRASGMEHFGSNQHSFLASLAPLMAFPLVGGTLMLATGEWHEGLADLGAALCAILAPPTLSYELARLWNRQEQWPRYATAFNWCQWVLPLLASVVLLSLSVAVTLGLGEQTAVGVIFLSLGCYALWLHWFLARHGLQLSRGRAALLVFLVNLGTAVLVAGPALLARATQG